MWIEVKSFTRKIRLDFDDEDEHVWCMLLVPEGSTDQQVLSWASDFFEPPHVDALRAVIEAEAKE